MAEPVAAEQSRLDAWRVELSTRLLQLRQRLTRARLVTAAVVFGFALACFELVLDVRIVNPTSTDWIFAYDPDLTQYYLAFAYYRNSAWHFPLTRMDTMLHPIGASFMLADATPLWGIPAKAVSFLLPEDFQYFGLWLFGCVLLSAVFSRILMRRLVRSRALGWVGTAFITLAPPFVARFPHTHLSAQWLILAAFWTVMEPARLPKKRIWLFSAMGLFIQPYLFAMVSVVLAAAVWVHRHDRRQLLIGASVWVLVIGASAWTLGYFGLATSTAHQADAYFADLTTLVSGMGTSSIVPALPMHGGIAQHPNGGAEGYAYLGLGGICMLVALVAALVEPWFVRGRTRALHPAWAALGVACLLLAAFATSPSPFLFGERLRGVPALTEAITPISSRFRTVGRFIWPLFYYVLVFGMQALDGFVARLESPRAAPAAAVLLLLAQAGDLGPWLAEQGRNPALTHPPPLPQVADSVRERLTPRTRYLVFDPPPQRSDCPDGSGRWRRPYHALALFGAHHHLTVNTDFKASARLSAAQLEAVCAYTRSVREHRPRDVLLVTEDAVDTRATPAERPSHEHRHRKHHRRRHHRHRHPHD